MLGTTLRTGSGLKALDELASTFSGENSVSDKSMKWGGKVLADFVNTYTIPAGMLKDAMTTVDPKTYGTVAQNDDVNFLRYMVKQATRSFPHATDKDNGYLEHNKSPEDNARRPYQSASRTKSLMSRYPLEKQLFGTTHKDPKNVVEKELARMQIPTYKLYTKRGDAEVDYWGKYYTASEVEKLVAPFIESKRYQDANEDWKRIELNEVLSVARKRGSKRAEQHIRKEAIDAGDSYSQYDKATWEKLPEEKRNVINAEYSKRNNGKTIENDVAFAQGLYYMKHMLQSGERTRVFGNMRSPRSPFAKRRVEKLKITN